MENPWESAFGGGVWAVCPGVLPHSVVKYFVE